MSNSRDARDDGGRSINRTEILRTVVANAESMGLRDRDRIEWLTTQVIERLESPPPLPGMEHLVLKTRHQQRRHPTKSEIQAIVKEILAGEEPTKRKETEPAMEPITTVKPEVAERASGMELTENALRVLERRYLAKDKQGQVIETPEEISKARLHSALAQNKPLGNLFGGA